MQNEPFFSIVLPCYNDELSIATAVRSITGQKFNDYELIIVDDGSSDETLKEVKRNANSKTRIFSIKNSGVSNARNYGIKSAKGKYVLFLDGDDYYTDNALERIYSILRDNNFPDILRYSGLRENARGKVVKIKKIDNGYCFPRDKDKILELLLNPRKKIESYVPLLAIKNKEIAKFDTSLRYLEDEKFYLENLTKDNIIMVGSDEPLYYYSFNIASKTKNLENFVNNVNDILKANERKLKILSRFGKKYTKMQTASAYDLISQRYSYYCRNLNHVERKQQTYQIAKILKKYKIKVDFVEYPLIALKALLMKHNLWILELAVEKFSKLNSKIIKAVPKKKKATK